MALDTASVPNQGLNMRKLSLLSVAFVIAGAVASIPASAAVNEVVRDPSFEANATDPAWDEFSAGDFPIVTNTSLSPERTARTGSWFAWLGGYDNADDQLWQSLTIPAEATGGALTFYYAIGTEEHSFCVDSLVVKVEGAAVGSPICSDEGPLPYTQRTIDLTSQVVANAGDTLELRFAGVTDGSLHTSFFIDDVSLQVTTPIHARTATLTLRRHLKATGSLSSDADACMAGRTVKVQKRKSDGTWSSIATVTTAPGGGFSKAIPDRVGRYRVVAPTYEIADETCAKATSPIRRHTH